VGQYRFDRFDMPGGMNGEAYLYVSVLDPAGAACVVAGVRDLTGGKWAETGDDALDLAEAELWLETHQDVPLFDVFRFGESA
jgi:hypothetical protein